MMNDDVYIVPVNTTLDCSNLNENKCRMIKKHELNRFNQWCNYKFWAPGKNIKNIPDLQ